MGTAVKKGILKPIRYISQMFDQKEPEMQIGFPTDVKHVAHIGSDGPNTSDPGWMKDYHSAPLNPTYGTPERDSAATNAWGSQGSDFLSGGIEESAAGDGGADSTRPRHSRRNKSDDTPDMGAAADSADGGAKKSRRGRKKEAAPAAGQNAADVPAVPKKSHRRRSKDEGSAKPSKSKAAPSAKSDAAAEAEQNSAPSAAAGGS
ncbi:uncharacterized protein LOC141836940 [Curcuma longa]|uniref:uncharacterized protein LOC141836940 n=1 Tax=Curcuma longa TaxID=136217 RepID=UPI003D9DF50A